MARQNRPTNFENIGTSTTPFDSESTTGAYNGAGNPQGFPASPFAGATEGGFESVAATPARGSTHVVRRPTTEEIRKRAYELFCTRKGRGGTPEDDWFRAERELIARAAR